MAGLLSLVQPGLGQIYIGHAVKGVTFLLLQLAAIPLQAAVVKSGTTPFTIFAILTGIIAFYMLVISDAVISARRMERFERAWYNRWYVYLGVFLLCFGLKINISSYIRNNIVQAFTLPSAAMEPTLLPGDFILVDRTAAGRKPRRGDIIVFQYPEDPKKDFIKRVAATGGDTVEIRDKLLILNGKPVRENYIIHTDRVVVRRDVNPRDNFGPVTVPRGAFFVLGDNRDQSFDSRFWGFVDKAEVKGTVRSIYWSWDRKKFHTRWERIGTSPH